MKDFNEKLESWINSQPPRQAGINNIQVPGNPELLIWQTRYKAPTIYEQDFIDNLITAFASDKSELTDLVNALNEQGFSNEAGIAWTEASFIEEIQRLGY
ncbi:recombinase-like helix-turn-helix domain-containing protein [Acinetobacter stercoris]|uniref:Recombinase-like domain-containing protein n=1 Tax=Acinetobacter stercoris TaxID=2126983 RepID=A0A2U3MXX6_9GAMM|nr:recombinase-like helix-turn-helix domain-containing protein [Acinetobacter stercoris]SPL70159.1 hypothetical protein KPC_1337 [Acinetobacter stercoris]